jgi:hypothetical protein
VNGLHESRYVVEAVLHLQEERKGDGERERERERK